MVCTGNICRSPMAEGALRQRYEQERPAFELIVDFAATHPYHEGSAPDDGAQQAVADRGMDISAQRSRPLQPLDFRDFDYVLAMDRENMRMLSYICPRDRRDVLHRLLDFAPETRRTEIPDPYQRSQQAFEIALDLMEQGTRGFMRYLVDGQTEPS